jgi:hypothetical protein
MLHILFTDILIPLFGTWTSPADLRRLDSSVCNKSDRLILLSLFKSSSFNLSHISEKIVPIKWIIARGVVLRSLFVKCRNHHFICDLDVSKLTHIDISSDLPPFGSSPQGIKALFARCRSLTSLHVTNNLLFNSQFILHCLQPTLLGQLTELRIILSASSFDHEAYKHIVSSANNLETLVIVMQRDKHVEADIIDIVAKNPRLVKGILVSLQFLEVEPDLLMLTKWDHIIVNNLHVAKFILYEDSIDSLLYFTSEKKNCLVGFDYRHSSINKITSGRWIFNSDPSGNCFVAFHESYERTFDDKTRLQSFFTHYAGFKSIYVVSSSLDDKLIGIISEQFVNTNNLQTVSFGKPSFKINHDSLFDTLSVPSLRKLMQACKVLNRIELRHFQHYELSDYVSLFTPPSSVRQIQLIGLHDKISVETVFAIFDAALHIEFIELIFESDHLYNLYAVRLHLIRKYCKLRGNQFCTNTKNNEFERGRYQIFRKETATYLNFVKMGQVCFYDWKFEGYNTPGQVV